jgi:hypothetical protein
MEILLRYSALTCRHRQFVFSVWETYRMKQVLTLRIVFTGLFLTGIAILGLKFASNSLTAVILFATNTDIYRQIPTLLRRPD